MSRIAACALVACLVPAMAAGASASESTPVPLLGANFMRYYERPPSCGGPHIVVHYHEPGVRALVREQLAAMRAHGLRALRLLLYHAADVRDGGELIPSLGGRLAEPFRSNLTNYLDDVRAAGFSSISVTFNPWFENDPIGYTSTPYDPAKLDENWRFIADVRALVSEHGPRTTRIDLINEGAPDVWQPRLRAYVAELWTRYADAFGTDDVVVSTIVKSDEGGSTARLEQLIDALRGTGRGLPTVFQVHPSWSRAGALRDLRAVDAVLRREGLSQPLLVGEEAYDASGPALGIAAFRRESRRRILEILEWPLARAGTRWATCPTAPYRMGAYGRALGMKPFRLTARVGSAVASLTSSGVPVTALGAGRYAVSVVDRSAADGFRLAVDGRNLRTGRTFRGRVTWRVRLDEGAQLRFGSIRSGLRRVVHVLGGGSTPG